MKDLLSVNTWVGIVFPIVYDNIQKRHGISLRIHCSLLTLSVGENTREPNPTGANVFRFDRICLSFFSSIICAYSDALKLASVMRTFCFPATGCCKAGPIR